MIDRLQEQIKVVAEARQRLQEATECKTSAYRRWLETNQVLFDNEANVKETCSEAENKLRELTLQAYAETGNKAPAVGVGIRERTILTYDVKIALDWAKAHRMALQLDKKAFEKIAKADPPDFVKITTEPQATIATNLEIYKEEK